MDEICPPEDGGAQGAETALTKFDENFGVNVLPTSESSIQTVGILMKYQNLIVRLSVGIAVISVTLGSVRAQDNLGSARNLYLAPGPADFQQNLGDEDAANALSTPLNLLSQTPFTYSFSVREGFDDNLFSTRTNKDSSFYTNFAGGVDYQFGGPRLQLSANLGGGVTYYYTRPGEKIDFNGAFSLKADYEATQRLKLSLATTTAYLAQPDTSIIGGTNRVDGDYIYTNTSIDASYQWSEKFSTITGYNLYANYYLENSLNDTLSYTQQTFKQSFNWLLQPKTTIVAEYRAQVMLYTGTDQDSFGNFVLLGFDQIFNPRFKWTLRAGVEQRFLNNATDGSSIYVGPYGESNLSYQFGKSSSIGWTARYGTEASGLTDVTQRQTFRTGLNLSHGFTPRISANLSFNYEVDYFDQANVITTYYQNVFDVSVGVNFQVNRFVSLSAGYQFTSVLAPQQISVEYNRNVVFAGANFSF
jgi:hypothetical protein